MNVSPESSDEEIISQIKSIKHQQENGDERQKDAAMIENAGSKSPLGLFFIHRLAVGALCRECLRLRQEVAELKAKLADKS